MIDGAGYPKRSRQLSHDRDLAGFVTQQPLDSLPVDGKARPVVDAPRQIMNVLFGAASALAGSGTCEAGSDARPKCIFRFGGYDREFERTAVASRSWIAASITPMPRACFG